VTGTKLLVGSVLDRFFLRDAKLDASVTGTITGVGGSAHLGIFDLSVVNGTGTITLNVSLRGSTDGSLLNLTLTPQVSGSASITLPIKLLASVAGVTLPENTALSVDHDGRHQPEHAHRDAHPGARSAREASSTTSSRWRLARSSRA